MMAVLELYLISVVKIMAPTFFKNYNYKNKPKGDLLPCARKYVRVHENKLLK